MIQDIATPLERGTYIGFYQSSKLIHEEMEVQHSLTNSVRNGSIAIGPILGGVLSQFLGFR